MSRAIDLTHLGRDRVICAYELDGLIVDPGPAACVEMLEGLRPRALLLTHIHLDHAGATGTLVRRFPDLPVYVHERGAPHLADPARLLASARRLYGNDLERLWGEIVPVPAENLVPLKGGELVEGMRVAATPGHASHHVSYLDEASGNAYTGDVAGVRIPPSSAIVAPTPPPDLDLDAWHESLAIVESWHPTALLLTHFGPVAEVDDHLALMREALGRAAEHALGPGREAFISGHEAYLASHADRETAQRYRQAASPEHLWLGLERYRKGRADRADVP